MSSLVNDGLKGSGDYGLFALGVYNGQTANNLELNNEPHIVTRLTYPFALKSQIIELSLQGYTGKFGISSEKETGLVTTKKYKDSNGTEYTVPKVSTQTVITNYLDQRAAASFILYPKPFGIQAEYTVGKGPEYNKATKSIEVTPLHGGYVTASYMTKIKSQVLIPFVRYQYYDGGKKHEKDARSYTVNEWEVGAEWQLNKNFELVVNYTISKRRAEDFAKQDNAPFGKLLRIQAQVNF